MAKFHEKYYQLCIADQATIVFCKFATHAKRAWANWNLITDY